MPEIKHQFTGGKMNKDLDERLVPNGEYRDAMNIQVSTSEGSNVGTIQNILGNRLIGNQSLLDASGAPVIKAEVVGSISIEKTDKIIYLVHSLQADFIIQLETVGEIITFVFVDNNLDCLKFTYKPITGINVIDGMLFWTDGLTEPKKINIERSIQGTSSNGQNQTRLINGKVGISIGSNVLAKEKHVTVIKKSPSNPLKLDFNTGRDPNLLYGGLVRITQDNLDVNAPNTSDLFFPGNSQFGTYDFSGLKVDDYIYITINSDVNGNSNFDLSATWSVGTKIVLKEYSDDGTPPVVPLEDYRIKGSIAPFGGGSFSQNTNVSGYGLIPNTSSSSQLDYLPGRAVVRIKVESINGFPPPNNNPGIGSFRNYVIDRFDDTEKLFEFKFPRFSYRYKYEDGEYSSFAPWSEIAFLPGAYDHHPRKGFNLGMTNRVSSLTVSQFVPGDIPLDVVGVDILYKEDTATSIYVVESISPKDETDISGFNEWSLNSYVISSETIKSILPSNQLLRTYDSVPRNALAQDMTGNRIVYANYLQGFTLLGDSDGGVSTQYYPRFLTSVSQTYSTDVGAMKSVKSLREYQLGVVFADQYGRETPVVSNKTGTIKLSKDYSVSSNTFGVQMDGSYPLNMDRFKFYIKETSGEYYNMVMDRFYDAQDGNVWLAFPSSDRNKIDIDTFLILKKGTGVNNPVPEKARYKVIAIENEAPDFVKTSKLLMSTTRHTTSGSNQVDVFGDDMAFAPEIGGSEFQLRYKAFAHSSASELHNVLGKIPGVELYCEFKLASNNLVSNRYKINSISCDYDATVDGSGTATVPLNSAFYYVNIHGQFEEDVNMITDDPTGMNSTLILDTAEVRFYRYEVENKPQFDGRFFVKIYSDGQLKQYIKKEFAAAADDFKVTARKEIHYLSNDMHSPEFAGGAGQLFSEISDYTGGTVPWSQNAIPQDSNTNWADVSGSQTIYKDYYHGTSGETNSLNPTSGWYPYTSNFTKSGYWRKMQFQTWMVPTAWDDFTSFPGGGNWNNSDSINAVLYTLDNNTNNSTLSPRWKGQPYDGGYITNWTGPYSKSPNENAKWFLDAGYYAGRTNTNAPGDDWQQGSATSGGGAAGNINGYAGTAVTNGLSGDADGSWVWLGFGPIFADNATGHFAVGEDSVNHKQEQDFIDKLAPGNQFRWKEDPSQTVYTVQPNISDRNRLRYWAGHTAQGHTGGGDVSGEDFRDRPDAKHPANSTKDWKFGVKPNMHNHWNPIKNDLEPITGGYEITLTIASIAGSIASVNATNIDDMFIIVDSIVGADATTGLEQQVVPGMMITEFVDASGASKDIEDSNSETGQYLLVREVEYDVTTNKYKLYLQGYQWPLRVKDIPGNAGAQQQPGFGLGNTVVFRQGSMNKVSPQWCENWNATQNNQDYAHTTMGAVGYQMEWIEEIDDSEVLPDHPAVWETEPKEYSELDIYYEMGGYIPLALTADTIATAIPVGSIVDFKGATAIDTSGNVSMGPASLGSQIVAGYGFDSVNDRGPSVIFEGVTSHASMLVTPWGYDLYAGIIARITKPDGTVLDLDVCGLFDTNFYAGSVGLSHQMFFGTYNVPGYNLYNDVDYSLPFFNCYAFGNGVESNRIRDNFNLPFISNGVKASTTVDEGYLEEHRGSGLIYSGIYNSISGVNNLNQFIQAEKITKDINPIYGSIQKIHSRDSDLVTLCEDKILKIIANKDAIFNADGNPQLISTPNVLGQVVPFSGEYGISKNPESFASESYRVYFTDKQRGVVLRLSKDGLTPISDYGMKDWFRDNLKLTLDNMTAIGSHDDYKNQYNLTIATTPSNSFVGFVSFLTYDAAAGTGGQGQVRTLTNHISMSYLMPGVGNINVGDAFYLPGGNTGLTVVSFTQAFNVIDVLLSGPPWLTNGAAGNTTGATPSGVFGNGGFGVEWQGKATIYSLNSDKKTITYREDVKGWTSFKSFTPENAISCANNYYTFMGGVVYKHHDPDEDRNTFYGDYSDSTFNVLLNDEPSLVKTYNTLNYEGSQSRVNQFIDYTIDGTLYVDSDYHNLEPKLGWYVNYINTNMQDGGVPEFINKEDKWFNYIQGTELNINGAGQITSTLDPSEFNFQGLGTVSNVNLAVVEFGCTDPLFLEFDANANTDDGTCLTLIISGCDNSSAYNYDAAVNFNDGSCIIYGCTDPTAFNYESIFTNLCTNLSPDTTCVECIPVISGCIANVGAGPIMGPEPDINGFCADGVAPVPGQTPLDIGYPNSACMALIPLSLGYDAYSPWHNPLANTDDGSCGSLIIGCGDATASNYDASAIHGLSASCEYEGCTDATAFNYNALWTTDDGSCCYSQGCMDVAATNYSGAHCEPCVDVNGDTNGYAWANGTNFEAGTDCCNACVYGCTNILDTTNYNPLATCDDGSCVITGCDDTTACNYDATVTNPNNSTCNYDCVGCTDASAFNYNASYNTNELGGDVCLDLNGNVANCTDLPLATFCYPVIYGCFDSSAANTATTTGDQFLDANTSDPSLCQYEIIGCTNINACNFIPITGDPSVDVNIGDNTLCCLPVGPTGCGCTDANAINYDPSIQIIDLPDGTTDVCNDGSCVDPINGCGGPGNSVLNGFWPDQNNEDQLGNSCSDPVPTGNFYPPYWVGGCMDANGVPTGYQALNFNTTVNVVNPSNCTYETGCVLPGQGYFNVMDVGYAVHDGDSGNPQGSCVVNIYGCLDEIWYDNGASQYRYNWNHGSGALGIDNTQHQGWSQDPVIPTGDPLYDVNTHNQAMCIPYDASGTTASDNVTFTVNPAGFSFVDTTSEVYTPTSGNYMGDGPAGCKENDQGGFDDLASSNSLVLQAVHYGPYQDANDSTSGDMFTANDYFLVDHAVVDAGNQPILPVVPYNYDESYHIGNSHWINGGTGVWDGSIDFSTSISYVNPWSFDPAIENACCVVSGCLHPYAMNFDAKGYVRAMGLGGSSSGLPMTNPSYSQGGAVQLYEQSTEILMNTPYVGVGTQVGALDWDAGGRACRTCTRDHTGQEFSRGHSMSKYFDGMNGPRGSTGAGAIVGSDGTGQYFLGAAGNEIYYTNAQAAGSTNNPWHPSHEEWWCCIFHDTWLEDMKRSSVSNGTNQSAEIDWVPGCTDPTATTITGWGSDIGSYYNPWWNNYNPSANIDDGTCCYESASVCNNASGGGARVFTKGTN